MSGNQFVIEEAYTFKDISYTHIKGHLGDDQDTTYTIIREEVKGKLVDSVFKKKNNEKGEPKFFTLKGEEIAEFFGNIEHKGISVSENYTENKSAEGYLEPEFAVGAFDSIRLMCNKPKKTKPKNTFVIESANSPNFNVIYSGYFEGDAAHYSIYQDTLADANNPRVEILREDDEIVSARPSENNPKLSGFLASMNVIKASDDYNKNHKAGVSLPLDDAVRFLSTLRDMVKDKLK